MRKRKIESWVVYQTTLKGQTAAINAVCEAGEWEAMQAAQPSAMLIRSGIASEGEAERLARGTSGDPVPRNANRPTSPPR
jgi:hypothetical protein